MMSRLTNDTKYEDAARAAMRALWGRRSRIGLVGNHIDVWTGKWKYLDSGIGPNQDSFYEYLLKAYVLFGDPECVPKTRLAMRDSWSRTRRCPAALYPNRGVRLADTGTRAERPPAAGT